MTHSSLFSPNNHIRHSHYLQPENTLAPPHPPTSFGKSSGFLKKIPSVLFNKEKTPIKKKSSKAHPEIYVDSSPKPMSRLNTSSTLQPPSNTNTTIPTVVGEKDKKTKKPRKALADLFGWGNHHHHNVQTQPISPVFEKASYAPAVPPKDNPAMLKKLNRPLATKSNNSHSGSLQPPTQSSVPSRPSIGDDPFSRTGSGAEVVDHVFRHGAQTPSAKSISLDRRASISSSKAMSYKTVSSDMYHEVPERTHPMTRETTAEQRRVSAPSSHAHQAQLVDLPPRSASLGKLLGSNMAAPLPQLLESPIEAEEQPIKTLKKEKTKSRVWGLLGRNKSKKEKVTTVEVPPLPAKEPWGQPSMHPPTGASLAAHIDDKYAAATMKSNVSSMRSAKQHRPPFLHISAPSMDQNTQALPATASTMSFPHSATGSTFEDHDNSPSKYPINSGRGGVWESVVGTSATRTSDENPCQAIEALLAPARLPKRKSLTGLFGVAIKKSIERIKHSSPPRASHHRVDSSPPRIAAEPTLRSLSEEIEEASHPLKTTIVPSDKFTSRFELQHKPEEKEQEVVRRDPSLRRVASATDKLFTLVSCLDFSPSSTNSPTLHHMGSHASLRQGFNGSPTPIRRVRSAMLSNKASGSSLKPPSVNVSPLKFALHRAQAAANYKTQDIPVSPPRESLVRKGMRNIFSPPSPVPPKHGRPSKPVDDLMAAKVTDERVGMGQTMGPTIVEQRTQSIKGSLASDVPADLQALISSATHVFKASPSPRERTSLGLPAPPPKDRIPSRRPGPAPPALSLPPVPGIPLPNESVQYLHDLDMTEEHDFKNTICEDMLSVGSNNHRDSFDFTNEFASLDQGDQRASFVEALKKVNTVQMFLPSSLPPVLALPGAPSHEQPEVIPSFHISKPSDSTSLHGDSDEEGDYGDDEALDETVEIAHVVGFGKQASPVRREAIGKQASPGKREPFKGQFAFQQHVATMPRQESNASFGAPEPVLSVPEVPTNNRGRRGHHRGESGLSIATMSSIGSVIGTGNEREYTNYFEVNFDNQQAHTRQQSITETIEEVSEGNSPRRVTSQDSLSSINVQPAARPTTRRAHHRRNSSIVSVDSLNEAIGQTFNVGPPVSRLNGRRTSYGYISRHRRNDSEASSFGRPDWAAHRRNSSSMSTSSNFSISQIARPGLGDRMFQLDGGVQLASITGSPPDEPAHSNRASAHQRQLSWDSLFDGTQSKIDDSLFDDVQHQSRDSIFDSDTSFNRSSDNDSLFGPEQSSSKQNFFLKGLRPVSTVSTATNASQRDDTFQHVQKYNEGTPVKAIAKGIEACLQADGEDISIMTPLGKMKAKPVIGRQMLGSSMSRPQKPGRRRPAHLIISEPPLDTPGLTSPSASETSSRLSLDTNAASITLGTRMRPRGAGHYRQKSSAGVKVDSTIHEMPSMATLRANKSSASPRPPSREPTIVGVDVIGEQDEFDRMKSVRNWVEWEREAVDEFRKTKNCWRDSEESKHALEDWKMPTTTEEIAAFIAQSTQAYKPLDQLPLGKKAHRRKSSLSDSRALCSPYGLPLPKPPPVQKPKMSLTTKYEKKGSTSSTISASSAFAFAFPFPDDVPEAPPGPSMFAQFTNESQPQLSSSSLTIESTKLGPFSFQISSPVIASDHFGAKKILESDKSDKQEEKRNRVTSTARRQALGWGRRRNSDGPEKTIGLGYSKKDSLPPMPNSAIPLSIKKKNSNVNTNKGRTTEFGNINKKKMNIFDDSISSNGSIGLKKNIFAPNDQENSLILRNSKSKLTTKNRSPVKKRTLRQTVSQPRTLRI